MWVRSSATTPGPRRSAQACSVTAPSPFNRWIIWFSCQECGQSTCFHSAWDPVYPPKSCHGCGRDWTTGPGPEPPRRPPSPKPETAASTHDVTMQDTRDLDAAPTRFRQQYVNEETTTHSTNAASAQRTQQSGYPSQTVTTVSGPNLPGCIDGSAIIDRRDKSTGDVMDAQREQLELPQWYFCDHQAALSESNA